MNPPGIDWQALLDAHQGPAPTDPDLHPLLRRATGEVTCRAMIGDDDGDVLPVPIKDAARSLEQRHRFAESLCEPALRGRVQQALGQPDPFREFDRALADTAIEALRWIEEERVSDVQRLTTWLRRSGVPLDGGAPTSRKILEFPRPAADTP